jgi:hypothetical protein
MGLIIEWTDVLARYGELDKLPNGTSPEVQANLILNAEAVVHGRLASRYSVPFSSSNYTARDLCVDQLYVQTQTARQPEKAKAVADSLNARITALLSGAAQMIASDGTVASTMVGDTVWSSTADYHPVFGMGPIEHASVSSAQVYDEAVGRGEL